MICARTKKSSFSSQSLLSSPHLSPSSLCSLTLSFTPQCFPQNLSLFVDFHLARCLVPLLIATDTRFVLIGLPLASFSIFPNVMRHPFPSHVYPVFVVFFAVAPSRSPHIPVTCTILLSVHQTHSVSLTLFPLGLGSKSVASWGSSDVTITRVFIYTSTLPRLCIEPGLISIDWSLDNNLYQTMAHRIRSNRLTSRHAQGAPNSPVESRGFEQRWIK